MDDIVTGNYFNKYASSNPLVRWVMRQYLSTLYAYLDREAFRTVLEAGCGEGEIVRRIIDRYDPVRLTGLDIDSNLIQNLRVSYPEHFFVCASLTNYHSAEPFDLVLCLEVLEHIRDYEVALARLRETAARRYVISVPNEPLFRFANVLRLKYLRRLGNTPGHVNNFSHREFRSMIEAAFPEGQIETRTCWIWSFAHIELPLR
jgi:2-polyprenyl-3-methyl-5-hydroxy-6-metoxy-1,4-benzoquinol methylase